MVDNEPSEVVAANENDTVEAPENEPDYRAIVNIQNRVLKDNGFEFNEESKKWERKPEAPKPEVHSQGELKLSEKERILLARSVEPEDIDEVLDFAGFKKVSVGDAMKDTTLQAILRQRAEERKTAQATSVKTPSRNAPRETPEDFIRQASEGNIPDSDEGIEALAQARIEAKRKK